MQDIWQAPAKLNLFLQLTGKRPDGYHTLQTSFVFLDFFDTLKFEVNPTGEVSRCDVIGGESLPKEDLCVSAAKLLQSNCGVSQGVSIKLEKRIAMGAGLGGGSSDAATCLIALNQLWDCALNRTQLAELGLKLGADVPVFIFGHAAWAEGLGEQLTPISPEKKWVCVLIPQIHVSTAHIFSNSPLTATPPITKIRGSFSPGLENALEAVTCALYPQVAEALNWLGKFGEARMSGSGASVFLACDTREQAAQVFEQRPINLDGFVAQSLNEHPHHSV
ncbi:MAG: 4-diphosphocytidyl-2-C-methyl-D-erythritol kinase [Saprospiraceae bacterium]|jgi:4-diphosphocytidyl-2-C-methyl-D-erythritol kinase